MQQEVDNLQLQQAKKNINTTNVSIKKLQAQLAAMRKEEEDAREVAANASKAATALARKIERQIKHLLTGAYAQIGEHILLKYPEVQERLNECTTKKEYAPIVAEFLTEYDKKTNYKFPVDFHDHNRYDYIDMTNLSEKQQKCVYAYLDTIIIALTIKTEGCTSEQINTALNYYLGKNTQVSGNNIITDFYYLPPDFIAADIINILSTQKS